MSEHEHDSTESRMSAPSDGQFAMGVELLSKALKAVFLILAGAIIVMLLWFLTCGGSFIVDSTKEAVVVLKFGKLYQQYDEGWHWFLPYPVNKIVRIPIIKQEILSKTFMPVNSSKVYNPNGKQDEMIAKDSLVPGKDGYVLLGDNSLMHSDWKMTYRIANPTKYFLNCMSKETRVFADDNVSGPDAERVTLGIASAMLKNLLDDAVIMTSAELDISKTYFSKGNYEAQVKLRLEENIRKADLGIALESLNLLVVAPPIVTFDAFQQLLLAETDSETTLEQARTYTVEQENLANTESQQIRADAQVYCSRTVSQVIADSIYFTKILKQFRENPEATFVSLFYGSLANAMEPVKDKFIISTGIEGTISGAPQQQQTLWLKLNQEPTIKRASQNDKNATDGDKK